MKPRLKAAPLTDEDSAIWMDHRDDPARAYLLGWRIGRSQDQDERDGYLMLLAADSRNRGVRSGLLIESVDLLDFIDCGGVLPQGQWYRVLTQGPIPS